MSTDVGMLIGTSLVSFLLSFMLMRVWLPFAPKRGGEVLLQVPVGLVQRLLIYRTQALAVLAFIVAASLPDSFGLTWLRLLPGTQTVALVAMAIIISLPLRYVFYDAGVALSNGVPRPYKSFRKLDPRDVRQGRRRPLATTTTIVLRGRKTARGTERGTTLYLPSNQAPAVVRLLRRHVR
jgi:hypothetical protein